tara:strand:- start:301 stop:507 length:207 start_codon:yes stop_codon:yes gene_type:complete
MKYLTTIFFFIFTATLIGVAVYVLTPVYDEPTTHWLVEGYYYFLILFGIPVTITAFIHEMKCIKNNWM